MSECSLKRVLATLLQAIPALHASDTNSDAPYSFLGRRRELPVSKEKASWGLLGGFSERLDGGRTKVQAFLLRASPGIVGSIARIRLGRIHL